MASAQWFVVALIVTGGITAITIWRRRRRDRQAMAGLARRLGLVYTPEDRLNLRARYDATRVMGHGYNQDCRHVFSGPAPHGAIHCFELGYEVGFGKGQEVRRRSVVVLESDVDLPPLWIDSGDDGERIHHPADHPVDRPPALPEALREWAADADRPCETEFHGRWIVLSVDEQATPGVYEWLIRRVEQAVECILAANRPTPPGIWENGSRGSPHDG